MGLGFGVSADQFLGLWVRVSWVVRSNGLGHFPGG